MCERVSVYCDVLQGTLFLCVSHCGHHVEDSGLNSKHGCVVSHHARSSSSAKNLTTKMRFLCVSHCGHHVEDSGLNSKHGCIVSHHARSSSSAKNLTTKMSLHLPSPPASSPLSPFNLHLPSPLASSPLSPLSLHLPSPLSSFPLSPFSLHLPSHIFSHFPSFLYLTSSLTFPPFCETERRKSERRCEMREVSKGKGRQKRTGGEGRCKYRYLPCDLQG
ncbi:hypothetical protein PoB_005857400 [Plakobranchus ocellatus]|uniref:C2H2-type domain-containing protein n=1 Tax=Plakobranchus ocellatus TaxID=259542 RepID=A0AAV4CLV8_9GAST|nr:hypothetical protein PoB_005857400 [Plakobranchus ocellatus]